MFFDARKLSPDAVIEADICIVGAGPAGISLAREFNGRRYNVVLLESGGLNLDESLQSLGQAGEKHFAETGPLWNKRQFGGNASDWNVRTDFSRHSVRLTRLSEIDFERRDWIENSGWPVTLADLEPHYERAQRVFRLEPGAYNAEDWEDVEAAHLDIPGGDIETRMFQFGTGEVFTHRYRLVLEHSHNVRVYHHATAVEVETDDAGARATGVRAASLPGREFRVRARCVVLAGGGMTCAHLLLLSGRAHPQGLGNRHDLVGRYFMDHPILRGGTFVPNSPKLFEAMTLYDLRTIRGVPAMGHLLLSEAALRRERLLQLSMVMFPREDLARALSARQERGVQGARNVRAALERRELPALRDLGKAVLGLDGVARRLLDKAPAPITDFSRGGWSKALNAGHKFEHFEVFHQVEQAPHRENRVYLGDKLDPLGCRKLVVDWRWHDEDMAATMRGQDLYAEALARAGLGRFDVLRPDGRPEIFYSSTAHYMGMTRMHRDPRHGVVDEQCQVHGVRNLYVASGSVFSTGGFVNPTLTIVALALRIGDRIKREFGAAVETAASAAPRPAVLGLGGDRLQAEVREVS